MYKEYHKAITGVAAFMGPGLPAMADRFGLAEIPGSAETLLILMDILIFGAIVGGSMAFNSGTSI
jgi:hypothetical protein